MAISVNGSFTMSAMTMDTARSMSIVSFVTREISSPVRLLEKNETESLSRCSKDWFRMSITTRFPTQRM